MKTLYKISFLLIAVFTASGCMAGRPIATNDYEQRGSNVTFDLFYQSLSPYGRWINYGRYGNAWVPRVPRNFRPYATNGHWVYSDYGWTWVSGYRWGWAPFHYGRWTLDDYYGWIWIPGEVWAPAWVAWRHSSAYYGWAPLGPGMHININLNIPASHWVFVPGRYITYRNINRYYLPWRRNHTVINNTTIINNIYEQNDHHYFSGPTRRAVQQQTHQDIRPVRVSNSARPSESRVTRDALKIYRPTISRDGREATTAHQARRVRVSASSDSRTAPERRVSNDSRRASERTRQGSNDRRTEATPPTRRPSRQAQPPQRRQNNSPNNNRSQRSEDTRTRRQRSAPAPARSREVQRRSPQRRVQSSQPSSRRAAQTRSRRSLNNGRSQAVQTRGVRRSSDDNSARTATRRTRSSRER